MKRFSRNLYIFFLCCLLSLTISGCATNALTGRSQMALVSDSEAIQKSYPAYEKMISDYREKDKISNDSSMNIRITKISNRLIDQAVKYRPDTTQWSWDVNVIVDNSPNAFCMAGGKMAIHTGIIEKLELNDDEIAAVMGHEIAHALAGHTAEKMSVAMATNIGVAIFAASAGKTDRERKDIYNTSGALALVAINLPNSREAETEADRLGIEFSARAGYRPQAGASLWRKMTQFTSQKGKGDFFSTHPSGVRRIEELEKLEPLMDPLYKEALSNGIASTTPNPWISNATNAYAYFDKSKISSSMERLTLATYGYGDGKNGKIDLGQQTTSVAFTRNRTGVMDAITNGTSAAPIALNSPTTVENVPIGVALGNALAVLIGKKDSIPQKEINNSKKIENKPLIYSKKENYPEFMDPEDDLFKLGAVELNCIENCIKLSDSIKNEIESAWIRSDWASLITTIRKSDIKSDISYFLLGRSAQRLGHVMAARIYYEKSIELSNQVGLSCSNGSLMNCLGLNLNQQTKIFLADLEK